MQTFPREITDYIAKQFYAYFDRKQPLKLTITEAQKLIDFVSGPAPGAPKMAGIDLTKPRVNGGGRRRSTEAEIDRILSRSNKDEDENKEWDKVFNKVISQYKRDCDQEGLLLIKLVFKERKKCANVCKILHISERTFFNNRLQILNKSAIFATIMGVKYCNKNCNKNCSSDI